MNANPLQHMTPAQRERYAERMESMARGKSGQIANHLKNAAMIARGDWGYGDGRNHA